MLISLEIRGHYSIISNQAKNLLQSSSAIIWITGTDILCFSLASLHFNEHVSASNNRLLFHWRNTLVILQALNSV